MKIGFNLNPTPTPIVSDETSRRRPQVHSESQDETASTQSLDPFVIKIGNKRLEVQPGELVKIVDKVNETAKLFNSSLKFEVNPDTNHVTIQVVDRNTGEILRQIPPEHFVETFHRMEDAVGLLFDLKL